MICSLRGTCLCLIFVAVNRICFPFIILLLQFFVETRFRRDWRSPNGVLVFIHMGKSRHSSSNICGKPSVVPRPNSFIGCQSCQSGGFSLNSILVLLIRSQNPFLIRTTNVNHNVGAERKCKFSCRQEINTDVCPEKSNKCICMNICSRSDSYPA